ncbi:hypothetical protein PN441_06925 [Spirulina major CS-329]|nr:hypothetical protein [Spirulina subsalsa]MDB9494309.1 hypothetical protein [Spirulina subsalsa CS-330]MDB9502800.1 hypothetical protein [Spirulina major CS-329]
MSLTITLTPELEAQLRSQANGLRISSLRSQTEQHGQDRTPSPGV